MTNKLIVLSFSLAALLSLLSTSAATQTYQWKDASGRTIVSSEPPPADTPGVRTITDLGGSPETNAAIEKSLADQELELRKRQQEEEVATEKEAKERAQKQSLLENCTRARRYLDALKSGARTSTYNEKGEIVQMNDEMRAIEISKVQADYDNNCVTREPAE